MQYGRPLYFCPVVSSSIFYLSIFFPRLFSAVGDWMSTILPHIVCLSANLGCRSESCCTWLAENTGRKKSPKIRQPVGQRVERTATVRSTGCKPGRTTGLTSGLTTGCIHDTVGCQTGLPTCLTTGWQPVVSYIQTFNRLSIRFDNWFDNRLFRVNGALVNNQDYELWGYASYTESAGGVQGNDFESIPTVTRRPASADSTARRQFQATGQPVIQTQASDAMTSWLPRYEAKCVQRRCFQCGSAPLRSDIKATELPPANILIPLERQLIALQLCRWQLLYSETLQQTFRPLLQKLSKGDKFRYFIPILKKLGAA